MTDDTAGEFFPGFSSLFHPTTSFRYFFALHPLSRLHSHWLQNHGHVFLLITWAVGALYAYFPLQYTSIVEIIVVSSSASSLETSSESAFSNFTDVPEIFTTTTTSYYQCSYRENGLSANQRRLFLISNLLLTFAIPCLTLTFSYISIIRKLLHDQRRILASMNSTPVMYSGGSGNGSTNENSKSNSGSGSGRGNSRVFSAMNGGFKSSSKVKIRLPSPTVRRIHKRQLNYIQTRLKVMFEILNKFFNFVFCSDNSHHVHRHHSLLCLLDAHQGVPVSARVRPDSFLYKGAVFCHCLHLHCLSLAGNGQQFW